MISIPLLLVFRVRRLVEEEAATVEVAHMVVALEARLERLALERCRQLAQGLEEAIEDLRLVLDSSVLRCQQYRFG